LQLRNSVIILSICVYQGSTGNWIALWRIWIHCSLTCL